MGSATPINQVGAGARCQTSGFGLWGFGGTACGNSLGPSRFCLVCSHWECRDLRLAGGNCSVIAEVTSDPAATSPHSLGDNQARSVTSLPITAGKPFNLGVIWGSPLGACTGSWGCQMPLGTSVPGRWGVNWEVTATWEGGEGWSLVSGMEQKHSNIDLECNQQGQVALRASAGPGRGSSSSEMSPGREQGGSVSPNPHPLPAQCLPTTLWSAAPLRDPRSVPRGPAVAGPSSAASARGGSRQRRTLRRSRPVVRASGGGGGRGVKGCLGVPAPCQSTHRPPRFLQISGCGSELSTASMRRRFKAMSSPTSRTPWSVSLSASTRPTPS